MAYGLLAFIVASLIIIYVESKMEKNQCSTLAIILVKLILGILILGVIILLARLLSK